MDRFFQKYYIFYKDFVNRDQAILCYEKLTLCLVMKLRYKNTKQCVIPFTRWAFSYYYSTRDVSIYSKTESQWQLYKFILQQKIWEHFRNHLKQKHVLNQIKSNQSDSFFIGLCHFIFSTFPQSYCKKGKYFRACTER